MPNTNAARKTMRQDAKRRLRNRADRSVLRKVIQRFEKTAAAEGELPAKETALNDLKSKIDKAAANKTIHKNKAARLKSRLAKRIARPTAAAK